MMVSADQPAARSRLRPQTLAQVLIFAVGAAVLAYLVVRLGSAQVWSDLRSIGWYLSAIIALEALVNLSNARVWWHTLPRRGRSGYFWRLLLVNLAGSAVNQSTPGAQLGGEPIKVMLLKERFSISVTTASLLSAKLAQALARVLFVIVGTLAVLRSLKFEKLPIETIALGFILTASGVGIFMALQIRGFSSTVTRISGRLRFFGGWVVRLERGVQRVDEHLHELYAERPSDFVAAVALGLMGLCVGVVQVWLLMGWLGLGRDWLSALAIEAFSVLVNFVLFAVPGSLGVQEGGKVLIFAALGLPLPAGLSMGLAFRLNSLASLAEGFVAFLLVKQSGSRTPQEAVSTPSSPSHHQLAGEVLINHAIGDLADQ